MPAKRTWIWIIVGFIGVCFITLIAVAGMSVYFVRQHIRVEGSSDANSQKEFERQRAVFKNQRPLLEVDEMGRPHETRRLPDMPASSVKPTHLAVMVWDDAHERLVHVSLPFWLFKFGRKKIDLMNGSQGFDLEQLNLDVGDLERIGPALVLDYRSPRGERVLVWTQ